ncbi:MAG: SufD family Fe-S cluster assembly protein [Candidatus Peribacteraceae bacterium]
MTSASTSTGLPSGIRGEGDGRWVIGRGKKIPGTVTLPWESPQSVTVHAEEGSRATVFLTLPSGVEGEKNLDVTLAATSSLALIVLASGLGRAKITQRIRVGEGAVCRLLNVTLGGRGVEQEAVATVEGAGGVSSVDWVFHAAGEDVQKLSVRNVFLARDGGGDVTMRGIAEGRAEVRCDGMMEIGEGGGGTAASLTQHVLMLDASAKVDAVPALRIKTEDVKAGHTATVTKVSEEELFYFASRGIPREEARRMYIRGFLGGLLGKVEDEKVRDVLEREMEECRMKN